MMVSTYLISPVGVVGGHFVHATLKISIIHLHYLIINSSLEYF
jgi:hypothetical protein